MDVNRDPANVAAYTGTYTVPVAIRRNVDVLTATFYADLERAGATVGLAAGTIEASGTSLELGSIVVSGTARNVSVIAPTSVRLGEAPIQLLASVSDATGATVAVSPGSLVWRIVTGADKISLTQDGIIAAAAVGAATVSVSIDGLSSPPAALTVTSSLTGPQAQTLSLIANDLAFDPISNRIWATIPSRAATSPSTVVGIDPATGLVTTTIAVGAEPDKIAITDDGRYAYVSVEADGTVRRLDLTTGTPVATFSVGSGSVSVDLAAVPGLPLSFATVADFNPGVNVRIFDNGVARSGMGAGGRNIQFAGANTLYGEGNSSGSLFTNVLDATSITYTKQTEIDVRSLQYSDGLLYTSNGRIIDPASLSIVGQLPTANFLVDRIAAVSSPDNRVYILTWDSGTAKRILSFDRTARTGLTPFDTGVFEGGAENLVACGNHTIAFNLFGVSTKSIVIVRQLP